MTSRALLILAPLALVACSEEKKVVAPPAPKPPLEIKLANENTEPDKMPAGWTSQMKAKTQHYAWDGKIYFEIPGDPAGTDANALTYTIDQAVAGDVTLEFGYTPIGGKPTCQASLKQGDKGETQTITKRNSTMKLEKAAGQPAEVVFSCTAMERSWGYVIQPRLLVAQK